MTPTERAISICEDYDGYGEGLHKAGKVCPGCRDIEVQILNAIFDERERCVKIIEAFKAISGNEVEREYCDYIAARIRMTERCACEPCGCPMCVPILAVCHKCLKPTS